MTIDAEEHLTEPDESSSGPPPTDAASLILVDNARSRPSVLLGRRHRTHVFVPNKFVFPGGSVELQDYYVPVCAPLHPKTDAQLRRMVASPSKTEPHALAVAAIREMFEETGLLVADRRSTLPGTPKFAWIDSLAAGVRLDLSVLHFVARAITPPGFARRFDTRFFCVDAGAVTHLLENVVHPDAEIVEIVWIPIDQAQTLDMLMITRIVLQELEARLSAGLSRDLPVPLYRASRTGFTRVLL